MRRTHAAIHHVREHVDAIAIGIGNKLALRITSRGQRIRGRSVVEVGEARAVARPISRRGHFICRHVRKGNIEIPTANVGVRGRYISCGSAGIGFSSKGA